MCYMYNKQTTLRGVQKLSKLNGKKREEIIIDQGLSVYQSSFLPLCIYLYYYIVDRPWYRSVGRRRRCRASLTIQNTRRPKNEKLLTSAQWEYNGAFVTHHHHCNRPTRIIGTCASVMLEDDN